MLAFAHSLSFILISISLPFCVPSKWDRLEDEMKKKNNMEFGQILHFIKILAG